MIGRPAVTRGLCVCQPDQAYCAEAACFVCQDADARPAECVEVLAADRATVTLDLAAAGYEGLDLLRMRDADVERFLTLKSSVGSGGDRPA